MHANLGLQLDFCNPLQRLAQNSGFELKLPFVGNVLVVASAALLEVGTAGFDAIGRRFDQLGNRASGEPGLLLTDIGFDSLSRQHEGNKDGHAAAVCGGRGAG